MKRRTVAVVVMAQGERAIVYSPDGMTYVCQDPQEVGNWVVDEIWGNENVPEVSMDELTSAWAKLAAKSLDALGMDAPKTKEEFAVHCMVSLDENAVGIVQGAAGPPLIVSGKLEVGTNLMMLARSDAQPKVPAEPPRGPWESTLERAGELLVEGLRQEAGN
jgi:hypothetical protein